MREELGVPVLKRGVLSPWDVGPSGSQYFSPPKQAVASSKPNFWTHSLHIHCNEPGSKTDTLQLASSVGSCLCDDECNNLLRWGQIPQGRLWWLVYCAIRGELPGSSQLNGPLASCAWPSPLPRVKPPRISRLAPIQEGGSNARHFQGAPWRDQFWKISTCAF